MSNNTGKVIALIDLNFFWEAWEVKKIIDGYNKKLHIKQLSKLVHRSIDEVAVLLIHLGREGKI